MCWVSCVPTYDTSAALRFAGGAVMAVGLAAGIGINIWTIIKYNKGLF